MAVQIPDYSYQEIFACGIRNLGFWNPYNSDPANDCNQPGA